MKTYVQGTGVRKWHGDELVGLQKETLDFLVSLVSGYSDGEPIIIAGCDVTSSGTSLSISPGYIGFPDGTGYVIAKFDGITSFTPPISLVLQKTTTNKLYINGQNKAAVIEYKAVSGGPGPGSLDIGAITDLPRLSVALVNDQAVEGSLPFNNSNQQQPPFQISGNINYRIERTTGVCYIWGDFAVAQFASANNAGVGAGVFDTVSHLNPIILPKYPVVWDGYITSQAGSSGNVRYTSPNLSPSEPIMEKILFSLHDNGGNPLLKAKVKDPSNYSSISGIFQTSYLLL